MTDPSIDFVGRARKRRLIIIVIITAVVELGLYVVVRLGPAFAILARPVYIVVLVIAALTAWHALRRRPDTDRRRADRRDRSDMSS